MFTQTFPPLPPPFPDDDDNRGDGFACSGRAMDTIVQDLVFGKKNRSRASTVSSKETTGSWFKDKHLLNFLKQGGDGTNGCGGNGAGDDSGGGRISTSRSYSPTTHFESSSSEHSLPMRFVGSRLSLSFCVCLHPNACTCIAVLTTRQHGFSSSFPLFVPSPLHFLSICQSV